MDAIAAVRQPPSLAEIRGLVAEGVREINLISQDTTYYGMDLWTEKANARQPIDSSRGPTLTALLREIEKIDGDFWVRLLYTHPAHWSGELIETIAQCSKIARYIDMPLQHIDETMLGRMRRETSRAHIENLIAEIRAGIPGIALRTTFIVGFPGETEAEFEALLEFIERIRFERLGIFKYSQEEGSRAAKMPGQISAATKNARFRRAMTLQQKIAREIAQQQIGLTKKTAGGFSANRANGSGRTGSGCSSDSGKPAPVGEFIERPNQRCARLRFVSLKLVKGRRAAPTGRRSAKSRTNYVCRRSRAPFPGCCCMLHPI